MTQPDRLMVERVAEAIYYAIKPYEDRPIRPEWEHFTINVRERYADIARAA